MKSNLEINPERIKKAAMENPCAKAVLESLFPEVFEEGKPFCKIGCIFKRTEYPDNIYSVFKWNGEVRILNITHNAFWDQTRNLKVSQLNDPEGQTMTKSEFKKLSGKDTVECFTFIDRI